MLEDHRKLVDQRVLKQRIITDIKTTLSCHLILLLNTQYYITEAMDLVLSDMNIY